MHKKIFKHTLFLVLFCLIFATVIIYPDQSYAKSKDITDTISSQDKENIRKLVKCFSTPCGYDLTEQMIQGEERGYKFSNASARQHILNLAYEEIYDQKIDEYELSKRLFGVKTSNVNLLIGNWGSSWPVIRLKYIDRLSSNKYKIKTSLVWHDAEHDTNTKAGEVVFTIKKKTNTYYGYVVKSLKIIKTSNF